MAGNIRDWCISRQLFGASIPHGMTRCNITVAHSLEEAQQQAGTLVMAKDDVSTLGFRPRSGRFNARWPEETPNPKRFYNIGPITGFDIIFLGRNADDVPASLAKCRSGKSTLPD